MRREIVIAALAFALGACRRGEEAEPAPGPKTVRCAAVETRRLQDFIEVRGTVAPPPDRDAQVAPQVSGRILRVEVREGDTVRAGQVVARVDDAPLADAARQAEAALARVQAEQHNAQTTLARIKRVFARGIAPRQEVDDAVAREASARAAVAEAEALARQAHRQRTRAVVRSPLAGVVLKVLRRPGELVDGTPATPIVEVADTSRLELVADVPGQDLVRITRGAGAAITFPAMKDGPQAGTVAMVAPAVDRTTGIGAVRIALQPSRPPHPPVGIFGVARIDCGGTHEVLLVPAAAVRNAVGDEAEVVVCGGDRRAHVRRVRPGARHEGLVAVSGQLAPDDRVAVEPVLGLTEGDPLEVVR